MSLLCLPFISFLRQLVERKALLNLFVVNFRPHFLIKRLHLLVPVSYQIVLFPHFHCLPVMNYFLSLLSYFFHRLIQECLILLANEIIFLQTHSIKQNILNIFLTKKVFAERTLRNFSQRIFLLQVG